MNHQYFWDQADSMRRGFPTDMTDRNQLWKYEQLKRKWSRIILWMVAVPLAVWIVIALGEAINAGSGAVK